ncbi:hypothetical protein EMA8858_04200 [Emticicia aquatica]|uniref:Uncharacterized protein n=1 Tax=Emticicia aquatica TaxID=1681835 RepID=A0ABM9AVJ1_9BACT|nr:hypothetical protein EMA8858_04200 [Emticicia aquatica]
MTEIVNVTLSPGLYVPAVFKTFLRAKSNEQSCGVSVTVVVAIHPFLSVTTTLYVPSALAVKSCVVAPFDHK